MDTQLTLVDIDAPLPERSARTVLSFTRDSLLNTTLLIPGTDSVVYVVKTNATSSRTTISRMVPGSEQGVVEVVRIDRNELLPSKITFEGFPPTKLGNWLKKRTFTDPCVVRFFMSGMRALTPSDIPFRARADDGSPRYVWKPTNTREIAVRRFQNYTEYNPRLIIICSCT